jgi:hypothetical protein
MYYDNVTNVLSINRLCNTQYGWVYQYVKLLKIENIILKLKNTN